ncbi:hypothetical protein [Neisseria sp. Ec49-e6-T10]
MSAIFRLFHDAAATNELPDNTRVADAPTVIDQEVAENHQLGH